MRRAGIVVGVVALVLGTGAGCAADATETPSASSVPPNDMPSCDEVYVQDAVIGRDNMGKACVANEEIVSPAPVRIECTDGRELVFNDLAWGYDGEPMTLTPADDPSKMPESEVDACVAPPAAGTATATTDDDDEG